MNEEKTKQEMPARVARWADLEGFTGGHPDSGYEGYDRKIYNVIGFGPPDKATSGDPESGKHHVSSPVGSLSSAKTAIDIDEGLNVAFLEVEPNNGVAYHSHDTNETFVVLDGRWHFFWGEDEGESVELGPRDTISFPGPAVRRFVNVSDQKGTLLMIIAGSKPRAFWHPEVIERLRADAKQNATPS
jgi:mannose-6-phosphate isomerase-like protein (cupin superfamily)